MNRIVSIFSLLLLIVFVSSAYGEDSELADLFRSKNLKGTIVLSSLDGDKTFIYNEERAKERFVPASTFKILNTLIALEEFAITDEKEIIEWDGKDKGLPAWNKDQSLETAFASSCIWFYQQLALRVSKDKYVSYLRKIKYGNEKTGQEVTAFWLEGDLMVSAIEQVDFLKKLYKCEYPFRSSSYEILKRLMVVEQTPAYTMRAKTGWAQGVAPQVGWFVGYVESSDRVWFFATNMEIGKPEDSRFRQEITKEALKLKGIL